LDIGLTRKFYIEELMAVTRWNFTSTKQSLVSWDAPLANTFKE